MKTRIEELIEDMDIELMIPHNEITEGLLKFYKDKFTEIDQSHITPIEALKASPKWVKALAMDKDGTWKQFAKKPKIKKYKSGEGLRWEFNCKDVFDGYSILHLNINYSGKWKNSLITREDSE